MEAGKLRHYVELQRVTVTSDSHGDQVKEWATIATAWASIEQLSGREFLQASQAMSDVNVRIRIRGRTDVTLTPKDRVLYAGREHDIVGVRNVGRRTWREIDAVARADQ